VGLDAGIAPLVPLRLERKLPGGLPSSHWNQAPFHGAPEFLPENQAEAVKTLSEAKQELASALRTFQDQKEEVESN
jgi:hypothetical protein